MLQNADIINTIGVTLILIGFLLLVFNVVDQKSKTYLLCNFFGSSIAGYGAYLMGSIPFIVLETVWAIVSFFALFKKK
ncbi:MAG: hypothetical protein J0M08_06690 [Bacteroidetes bacterium]|nr:hypothetical protein [Bacteroidota bacterium]